MTRARIAIDDVLSSDMRARRIELAFVERMLAAAEADARRALRGRVDPLEEAVTARLALVASPVIKRLADALSERVDVSKGFGPFGDRGS
jgi:hypothetical protein